MQKPYIVYLNKSYNVWLSDAYKWAQDNNIEYQHIISEVVFWAYMDKNLLNKIPILFCKDITTKH